MRTALLLLAIVATPVLAAQTVWKWVDERGVTHYSDRPMPGATKMELNVTTSSPESTPPPAPSNTTPREREQPSGPPYREFAIARPASGEHFINTGGVVEVTLQLDPYLQSGHSIALYLDGQLAADAGSELQYSLTEVPRGEHSLVAVITDQDGRRLQETAAVQFLVRQTSIANPPVGPALRPPPRPRPRGASNKLPTQQPSYATLNGGKAQIDPKTNLPVKTKPASKKP